jgi:hypothetical protein
VKENNMPTNPAIFTLFTGVSLTIQNVEPREPIEGAPIAISFTAEAFGADQTIRVVSNADAVTVKLTKGQSKTLTVRGVAPTAGLARPVVILAYADPNPTGAEFPNPIAESDPYLVDVSAQYEFRVETVLAKVTRDNYLRGHGQHPKDFLIGSTTALYGGAVLPDPGRESPLDPAQETQTEQYGWIESGTLVRPNMRFGPFGGVPGKAPDLVFSYIFARAAKDQRLNDAKVALDAISAVGRDIAKALYPVLAGAWDGVHELHKLIHSAIFANCDGVVALDKKVATSLDLAALTDNGEASETWLETRNEVHQRAIGVHRGRGVYSETRIYVGSSSPGACGSDLSEYHVRFTFDRISYPGR